MLDEELRYNIDLKYKEKLSNNNRSYDLWNIIEKSKENTNLNPMTQYNNLIKILKDYSIDDIKALKFTWDDIAYEYEEFSEGLYRRLFERMNFDNYDTFHFDFVNWLIVQGKELFDNYKNNGAEAILSYINDNDIRKEDYTFECMAYIFDVFDIYTLDNYIGKFAIMEQFEGLASKFFYLLQRFNIEKKIDKQINQRDKTPTRYDKYYVVFNSMEELMDFKLLLEDTDIKITNKYEDFGDNVSIEPTIIICNDY
jgi:hypothetical protein